jgi:sugar phosphate isomerase/epimerase
VPRPRGPGTGAIGWENLFRRIDEPDYAGWIGCEYNPPPPARLAPALRRLTPHMPTLSGIGGESFCLDRVVLRELV